MELKSCKNH